ncbi:hypothetical protein KC711_00635 [Candidatus Peregrinibacteria bacterium]|nr:hypothetical protein [Candidatus Peregrinibacteria bacterium]
MYIVHTNAGGVVPKSSTDIHLQSEDKLDEKSRKEVIDFIDFTTKIRSNYATIFGKQIQDSEITSIIKNNLDNISY